MSDKVFLVIDDIGIPNERPDLTGVTIEFSNYQRLLRIAEENDVCIPVAVTAAFLDTDNISGLGLANKDSERIVLFLSENQQYLPVWNHGLSHRFEEEFTEFGSYKEGKQVSNEIQREHLEVSQQIFSYLGLGKPDVFVPPAHAWILGVTDLIAGEIRFKYMAIRQFEKRPLFGLVAKAF